MLLDSTCVRVKLDDLLLVDDGAVASHLVLVIAVRVLITILSSLYDRYVIRRPHGLTINVVWLHRHRLLHLLHRLHLLGVTTVHHLLWVLIRVLIPLLSVDRVVLSGAHHNRDHLGIRLRGHSWGDHLLVDRRS